MTNISRFGTRATLPVFVAACSFFINPALRAVEAQDSRTRPQPRVDARVNPRPDAGAGELPMVDLSGLPGAFNRMLVDPNRAVIGLTMSSGGRSDTLGVLVGEVSKGGPAEKAGIKEGSRITAINGVNLRVSSSDADDEELRDVGQRRLQREMAKAKAGDDVELRVTEGGASKTLKLKAIAAADLEPAPSLRTTMATPLRTNDNRASLGITIGNAGNMRDTLGLFVSSVITKGPAETAGVVEGDRIASINGVDVRVPKEDAEDGQAASARVSRFTRELAKAAPGDKIALKVYTNGHFKDVTVIAGKGGTLMDGTLRMNGDMLQMENMLRTQRGGTIQLPRVITLPPGNSRVVIRRNSSVL